MQTINCRTLFDITRTDVRHNFSRDRLPMQDATGRWIRDHRQWMLARNQQRNWETVLQILGLRLQPQQISTPQREDDWWSFEFAVEDVGTLALDGRQFGQLEQDCSMIPMLIGLEERVNVTPMLIPGINIVFSVLSP